MHVKLYLTVGLNLMAMLVLYLVAHSITSLYFLSKIHAKSDPSS